MSLNTFQQQTGVYKTGAQRNVSIDLASLNDNVFTYEFGPETKSLVMAVAGATGNVMDKIAVGLGVNGFYDLFQTIIVDGAAANVSLIVECYNVKNNKWVMKVTSEDPVDIPPGSFTYKEFSGQVNSIRLSTAIPTIWNQGSVAIFSQQYL